MGCLRERDPPGEGLEKLGGPCGKVNSTAAVRPSSHGLTPIPARGYLTVLDSRQGTTTQDGCDEADLSAQEPQTQQQAWLPGPHEDPGWARDAQPAPEAGAEAPLGEDRLEVVELAPGRGPEGAASGTDLPPDGGSDQTFGFPRSSRIGRGAEIRSLLRRGRRTRTSHLDVFHDASPVSIARWGLVVPKYGRSAVERNKLKRRLREIGRTEVLPALRDRDCPLDVLVRARREAYEASYHVLRDQLAEVTESLCSAPFSSV